MFSVKSNAVASLIKSSGMQFLLGFVVCTAYLPGIFGAAIPTTYLVLMIVMPLMLLFCDIPISKSHLYGTLFLIYATVSLLWSMRFNIALYLWIELILLAVIFCYGSTLKTLKHIFAGMAAGMSISAVISIAQYFYKFDLIYHVNSPTGPAGLFINPNMFAETSVILLIGLIILKLWWWIPVTLPGVLIHTRASMLALILCALAGLWKINRIYFGYALGVIIFGVLFFYNYHTFDQSSLNERYAIWHDTFKGLIPFGHGVGSFEIVMPKYAEVLDTITSRTKFAHNDYLQLIFDFGIGSLLLIPIIWNIFKSKNNEKFILLGIGVIALFSFPLHVASSAFVAMLVSGYINRVDDTYWYLGSDRRLVLSTVNKT